MTDNSQQRFGSNRAYGYDAGGDKTGTIVSIKDPENRGRVQVRFHGYHDAQGVNKDDLEWVHVRQQNSQIAGHTATQPFYAGSHVTLGGMGGEHYVSGGAPGFDSEKRLSGEDPPQLDNSSNQKPDLPNFVRGDKQTSVRSSPGCQPDAECGATKYFNYSSWDSMFQHMYPYALGTGNNKSPFNKGDTAKLHQLKSLGTQKMQNGSDVLDDTDKMDDNFSGAFKPATKVVRNLRNNGYGNGIQQMGGQQIGEAEGIFNGVFGTTANNSNAVVQSLINLILSLIKAVEFVDSLTPLTLYDQINNFGIVTTPCQNIIMEISSDLVTNIENDVYQVMSAGGGLPTSYYQNVLSDINNNFTQAMAQGSLNLLVFLNNMTGTAPGQSNGTTGGPPTSLTGVNTGGLDQSANVVTNIVQVTSLGQIVYILGGVTLCTTLANDLLQYDNLVGIPQAVTYATCQGVIGLAIQGKLGNIPLYTPANTAPAQSTDSPNNPASMSKWTGNKIAMGELMSGQLNKDFLTGIQKKYQDVDRNHGPGSLKKHTDRIPNYSDGPSKPLDYKDTSLSSQMDPWTQGQGYDAPQTA